jgi:drug/metabolite transporter (DMT)-like permease
MIGELAALGAAVSWAIAPLLYRQAISSTNPISANITRLLTNGIVLAAVLVLSGAAATLASFSSSVLSVTIVSGILNIGLGDTLYLIGIKALGVSRAVPIAATYPLFSLIWAVLLLGQPLPMGALAGAGLILAGIWLLSMRQTTTEVGINRRAALFGVGACLGTAVAWSLGVTLMDVAIHTSGAATLEANFALVTLRIVATALLFLLLAPLIDRPRGFLKMSRKTVVLLCLGGLVSNAVGWLFMNISFLSLVEAQAVPISSTSPLFAALLGFLFLHEKASLRTLLGVAAIVAGIVLIFIV